ncbi:MAG: hypothetical protein ACPH15_03195 [Pseudomonadales bacterium]
MLKEKGFKHHEFWHPRLFEFPFYLYLGFLCLIHRVAIPHLAKANSVLNHGEIGIGSKFHTQQQFDQNLFLPTAVLAANLDVNERVAAIQSFAAMHGYPVILKPDIGLVGKGIIKVTSEESIRNHVNKIDGEYLIQQFTPFQFECGIFYVRQSGQSKITGINQKHFPTVVGNGKDNLQQLAVSHYRYTHHWTTFLQYFDLEQVPAEGEEVCLSFIGSHTMGCKFTDDTHWLTPALEIAIFKVFETQPKFNFGRLDIKAESREAMLRGEFVIIEINGVSSLPTHMFDPKYSLCEAYKIFFKHGRYLVNIAKEHRHEAMDLLPLRDIMQRVKNNQNKLDKMHMNLKSQQS